MNDLDNLKEAMSLNLYGRSRNIALANGQCVKCGEFNLEFNDGQDSIFGE